MQKQKYSLHEDIAYASESNKHEVSSTYTTQHRVREMVESYKIEPSSVHGFKAPLLLVSDHRCLSRGLPVDTFNSSNIYHYPPLLIYSHSVSIKRTVCVRTFRKGPVRAGSHPEYGPTRLFLLSCIVKRVSSFTFAGCIPTNRVFHSRILVLLVPMIF